MFKCIASYEGPLLCMEYATFVSQTFCRGQIQTLQRPDSQIHVRVLKYHGDTALSEAGHKETVF